jgi:type II secretory pathway pseudopilin PulG
MKVFNFSRGEKVFLVVVFAILLAFMTYQFQISLRKGRDFQRKQDVRDIFNDIEKFEGQFGYLPMSLNGKIVGCRPQLKGSSTIIFSPCEWGESEAYFGKLPQDPYYNKGWSYYFISDGRRFQVYASLEGKTEAEYDPEIEAKGIKCGERICNFGLFSDKMR